MPKATHADVMKEDQATDHAQSEHPPFRMPGGEPSVIHCA
jgi:hypothetical protein